MKKCKSYQVVKNGKRLGKQRYLCNDCKYVWELGSNTKTRDIDTLKLLHKAVMNNQTYASLAKEYGTNIQSIQNLFDSLDYQKKLMTI